MLGVWILRVARHSNAGFRLVSGRWNSWRGQGSDLAGAAEHKGVVGGLAPVVQKPAGVGLEEAERIRDKIAEKRSTLTAGDVIQTGADSTSEPTDCSVSGYVLHHY